MSNTNLTRTSRDGDQFHYLWGARRCLNLLSPITDLVAISIEGPSPDELSDDKKIEAGEEILDIAEYFGSEKLDEARLVRYLQLKHSTVRENDPWTASGLEKTVKGFAKRYSKIQDTFKANGGIQHLEFWFVTNRPISIIIREAIEDAAKNASPRHPLELKKLQTFTNLKDEDLASFFKLFHFEDGQEGYWEQRNILSQELNGYLSGSDTDAPVQLKELVTRKALSESEENPSITKIDVLRVLRTDESRMFPAKCQIKEEEEPVQRKQEIEIIESILENKGPFVIYAEGGVGKTVFATRISNLLPEGSITVLYDCFGNGQYRSPSGYRHRHKDALVQIANELASKGLCHPLIPSSHADSTDYVRAFIYRLKQATEKIRLSNPNATLAIVIDAADNSQMAAQEVGEIKSFAPDLIRESVPEGIRLVFLCRPHRQALLDPPAHTISIELKPFNLHETSALLLQKFPDASTHDINEFHRLSSQNPRVQALALSRNLPLSDTLRLLGPNPTTVEDTIAELLNTAIEKLKSDSVNHEKEQIERICIALAALRPLIPIAVLSAISGIEETAIKSFAFDIGRPLLVTGEMIQFLDEPAESWFRKKFKPSSDAMRKFINILKPLALKSVYISSILPQLMLEAGSFTELVELALSTDSLPDANELERRDIEFQRLQFALKASLRTKHYPEAAKLALKAGGESASEDRQANLLQNNTDLASAFLSVEYIQDIVSRHIFGSSWTGSHHVYEASILSGKQELLGDARSRLRMANEWLHNLMKINRDDREGEHVSVEDIVELTLTHLNIHGPETAAKYIRTWTPRETSYSAGKSLTKLLINHSRWSDIDGLAMSAGNNLYLTMAITVELSEVKKLPPIAVCTNAIRLLKRNLMKVRADYSSYLVDFPLQASIALLEACFRYDILSRSEAETIIQRYVPTTPPRNLGSRYDTDRFVLLKGYCLLAALKNENIELIDLAYESVKKEMEKDNNHSPSRELREFKEVIGGLLPWQKLWANNLINHEHTVDSEAITKALSESSKYKYDSSEYSRIINEIALCWMEILHLKPTISTTEIEHFTSWKDSQRSPFYTRTLNALCRLCGQNQMTAPLAFSYASESYELIKNERVEADHKSGEIIEVARAIMGISHGEAKAYFDEAMTVAGKLGTENFERWGAIVQVAKRVIPSSNISPQLAFQFARCAELTQDYTGERYFDWDGTVEAITKLSPTSTLPIISRWRDRKFGIFKGLLPNALSILTENGHIDARDSLSFIAFRNRSELPVRIESALKAAPTDLEKIQIMDVVSKYLLFMDLSSTDLKAIKQIALRYQITLNTQLSARIDSLDLAKHTTESESSRPNLELKTQNKEKKSLNWNEVFQNLVLETPEAINIAYIRFKEAQSGFYPEDFFKECFKRAPLGNEPSFINSITHFPGFSHYQLETILRNIPSIWHNRPAIKNAIGVAVKSVIKRNFTEVNRARMHGAMPSELLMSIAGVNEREIVEILLSSSGETADHLETSNLFSIVGLLSNELEPTQVLEVLRFALSLYDSALEDTDGDGIWHEGFLPPPSIEQGIAGYIWSALGSPEATCRWEAAHVVLELCKLGRENVIEHLISLSQKEHGLPYVDAHLEFYFYHALQWLLIGFSRASMEIPQSVAKHGAKFVDLALVNQSHVLIRKFAAQIALNLNSSGHISLEAEILEKLKNINKSKFPKIYTKSYDRSEDSGRKTLSADDQDIYYFGIDFGPYWLKPLGNVFSISENEIAAQTIHVIKNKFAVKTKSTWREDERLKRNLYQDRETWHSHGSSPRTDNLQFYHSYHAMMMVAGELLATRPLHSDPDYDETDEFEEWLSRHDLSRQDRRWLWDRRDPEPLSLGKWLDRSKDDPEYRSLPDDDFINALIIAENLVLSGDWTEADSSRSQSYHVSSALVNPEKADSLLRALSTTLDPLDYYIPSASSDRDINKFGHELKGWIAHFGDEKRLDEYDPWAGDISYSVSRPAGFIVDLMKIEPDQDFRYWVDENSNISIETEIWGRLDDSERNSAFVPNNGKRLIANPNFIRSMLEKLNRNMIIEVQIERHKRHRNYEREDKIDNESIKRTSKVFLIDSSGKIRY